MRGLQRRAAYEVFDIRLARIIFDCVIAQSLSKMEMQGQAAFNDPQPSPESEEGNLSPPPSLFRVTYVSCYTRAMRARRCFDPFSAHQVTHFL